VTDAASRQVPARRTGGRSTCARSCSAGSAERLGGTLVISGAFPGCSARNTSTRSAGYRTASVVEDSISWCACTAICAAQTALRDPFIPDPVAWTEVPESGRIPVAQRGAVAPRPDRRDCAVQRDASSTLVRPRGFIAMPFFTFGEMLAPLVEVWGT